MLQFCGTQKLSQKIIISDSGFAQFIFEDFSFDCNDKKNASWVFSVANYLSPETRLLSCFSPVILIFTIMHRMVLKCVCLIRKTEIPIYYIFRSNTLIDFATVSVTLELLNELWNELCFSTKSHQRWGHRGRTRIIDVAKRIRSTEWL